MKIKNLGLLLLLILQSFCLKAQVEIGLDRLFTPAFVSEIKDKKVGLITNQSAVNRQGETSFEVLKKNQKIFGYQLKVVFAPEHGIEGKLHASEHVRDSSLNNIPIYSLHGSIKRPTKEMLEGLDVLIYDIQNVGTRCYTYETTLFYSMEEAAKYNLTVLVLDRPDPRGGTRVEGNMVEEGFRCFFSYHNVPFCHGMTIAELAQYFNAESKVGCPLKIIPMKGWRRSMSFSETGLTWVAPSPNIPDAETTLVYPATIFLGETLEIVSVDLRGEYPFKRLGAPWISSEEFALFLNQMNLPGVLFFPHSFTPKWGKYENQKCEGVFLKITNEMMFQPLLTQYVIFEKIIELYPDEFDRELENAVKKNRKKACDYITGSTDLFRVLESHGKISTTMKSLEEAQTKEFLDKRARYLLY